MITFLYGAPAMFGIKYDMIATPMREDGLPTFRLMHYTFLFQVFVIMNLFNMWNCRMLPYEESKELNIFTRPFSNWWFIIVFFAELNMQYFMTSYNWTAFIFDCTPISLAMQLTAIGCGLGTWLVALCVKYIPEKHFDWKFPEEEPVNKSTFNSMLSTASHLDEVAAGESE